MRQKTKLFPTLRQLLSLLVLLGCAATASAYDFEADGIYYVSDAGMARVTYATTDYNSYSGDIVIPETVEGPTGTLRVVGIDPWAFKDCINLTNVTLPNSITSIGLYAFQNCSALTELNLPNSLQTIDKWAFYFCTSLAHVTFGESVISIGASAFMRCSNLANVSIPNSVITLSLIHI